ncbi:MAG TPA: class I SAM-dependent methyltransferase, partial [Thermoanaerobaculia bacterium]|nr:class I SAM-dependent methyltransferase [Thermoanaerobaculia bacterium]
MKIGIQAENPLEALALALGLVPVPMAETLPTLLLARSLMAAARFGVFAALSRQPLNAAEVAERCGTHPGASRTLLDSLVSGGHLVLEGERYALSAVARKWLAPDSPLSLHDNLLFRYVEWDWIARLEEYLQHGRPLNIHGEMTIEQWSLYQRGMFAFAKLSAEELARRAPVPRGAREMLDLGGSHGFSSVVLCRKHSGLHATVFDLPSAVEHAAPLLAEQGMGDRVVHKSGDALTEDFGEEHYDFILVSQFVHHFDGATNR